MKKKSYYSILGVSRTESPCGIRTAYRHLAKKLHPDIAGEHTTRAFQEIAEAYGVLSDPQCRADYNRRLDRDAAHLGPPGAAFHFVPEAETRRGAYIAGEGERSRRSFEICESICRTFFLGMGAQQSSRCDVLNFEVLLTPEEAAMGCVVPVPIPMVRACPDCGGADPSQVFACIHCQNRVIEYEEIVHIVIPAIARSEAVFEIPVALDICRVCVRLDVSVDA